jgi:hypothetical protein
MWVEVVIRTFESSPELTASRSLISRSTGANGSNSSLLISDSWKPRECIWFKEGKHNLLRKLTNNVVVDGIAFFPYAETELS